MNSENIKIAFCFDNNLMYQACITIASLVNAGKKEHCHYDIYCICSNGAEKIKDKLQGIISRFDSTSNIYFIKAQNEYANGYEIRNITAGAYLRLQLHTLLPDIDKIIYADIDVLFQKGLQGLWDINLEHNYIGGSLACGINQKIQWEYLEKEHEYFKNKLQRGKYVQSGVLIMNLKKIRADNLDKQWSNMVPEPYYYLDQDILNITCLNHIKTLPVKYNMSPSYTKQKCEYLITEGLYSKQVIEEGLKSPVIIHYAGEKPWDNPNIMGGKVWLNFVNSDKELKEIYDNYFKSKGNNKLHAPLIQKIFSIKNQTHKFKKYKVITIAGLKIKIHKKSKLEKLLARKYDPNLSLDDKKYIIEHQFEQAVGYKPNIDNPRSFNEKMQWLKLYNEDPLLTKCADKYLVREYVKEKIGEEYLIPLLGVWDSPDDIDFDKLPNQFVLKVNWGSGQNIIVKDKAKLDIEETKTKLREWLSPHSNHYYYSFEWSYKNIKPKIIAEQFIQQLNNDLYDYKFFSYRGKVKNLFVVSDRFNKKYFDFYDTDWNKLPFERVYHNSPNGIIKPQNLDRMISLAETLSKDFPFARVDFYDLENKIYFGEITFYPGNGMEAFEPVEWDYKLGEMLTLPTSQNGGGGKTLSLTKFRANKLYKQRYKQAA